MSSLESERMDDSNLERRLAIIEIDSRYTRESSAKHTELLEHMIVRLERIDAHQERQNNFEKRLDDTIREHIGGLDHSRANKDIQELFTKVRSLETQHVSSDAATGLVKRVLFDGGLLKLVVAAVIGYFLGGGQL